MPIAGAPLLLRIFSIFYRIERLRGVMDCPVCLAVGENLTPTDYHGLVVRCLRCGVYRIMKSALVALPKLKVEKRLEALLKAKTFASSRAWPTISKACF